ncbi:Type I restriction-modification system, M subunit [Phytophthora megakarya]|uniref:Type I restriction-modification system, M subunit n=1 Tax=Phytophthora megakarya TaxID=4795 RepID=A0A225V5R7_9STRA|nr:Type I restriction-modification system, M subunit [Phytophthora megakarya]
MALELRGFNADRGRFLLTARPNSNDDATAVRIFERELADLQRWDRLRRSARRLPTKRLRKLMAASWVRGDCAAGWCVELQKNVSVCEDWINATFSQLLVPQQQQFLDEELYTAAKRQRVALRAERKHARDLQQYFTSAELVELVVERVMQHARALGDVLWLEPSCGDGRFMTALLQAGARHVVGYEVDEKLHSLAEKNVRQAAEATDSSARVYLGDFLRSSSSVSRDKVVVAVGNPPFGAKGGDGSDLVHHFFRHTAREWRARVIAFIVPERCSRPGFVETTLQQLQPHDTAVSWKLATELPLTDHHFEFGMGDQLQRVRQPSVLQIWSAP